MKIGRSLIDVEQINGNVAIFALVRSLDPEEWEENNHLHDVDPIFTNTDEDTSEFVSIIAKKTLNAFVSGISFGLAVALVDNFLFPIWNK